MLSVSAFIILLIGTAVAFRDYQEHIPNGDRVPDPCHPNKLWQGVGHKQLSGGGDRNPFGKDFKEAGKVNFESIIAGQSESVTWPRILLFNC